MSNEFSVVSDFMTALPETVQAEATIDAAESIMRENGVHHLPVFEKKKLVGIVTDLDIKLAFRLVPLNSSGMVNVADVMQEDPYMVRPDDALEKVLLEMAKQQISSALVADGKQLLGIFTVKDALTAFARVLRDAEL